MMKICHLSISYAHIIHVNHLLEISNVQWHPIDLSVVELLNLLENLQRYLLKRQENLMSISYAHFLFISIIYKRSAMFSGNVPSVVL